jgi:flagellar protein FliO/FliZ
MNSLFGLELPTPVNLVIAFVVVLFLIGAAAWIVRRLGAAQFESGSRGRQPRLAVIDSAAVDARRKLVIIRRDNVEHLLMIGGPTDVVVETNIVRAAAAREPAVARNGDAAPRAAPPPEPQSWPLQPDLAPAAAGPARTEWPSHAAPAEPPREPAPAEPAAGAAMEPPRAAPRPIAQAMRATSPEPADTPRQPAATAAHGAPINDQGLAEMAHRLEAALRRPAMQRAQAEAGGAKPATAAEGKAPARSEPKPAAAQMRGGPQPQPQSAGDLEQEMASLLGRPGKT